MVAKHVRWNGEVQPEAVEILEAGGGMVVSPTKVGYIVATTDLAGLERKFAAKNRKRNKPAVVLCGSLDELRTLAQLNPEIDAFYEAHWNGDILLGCILPWSEEGKKYIPEGAEELVMDARGTSCFVVKFGVPGENLARYMWETHKQLIFASSANPSGKGNRGLVEGIGEQIDGEADLVIEADDYVASIQPNETVETRYEQGVMVSMVDADGTLVPEQKGERLVSPAPVLIRRGLYNTEIMELLAEHFLSWDYRQGMYY
ncbi:L-threonylcarbamoyladenylate synthase [Gulosibacter faecalis]|jgi:tRNA A37 threonylcarbamoyladenosine synthetase subunit TsaC/SUA5/YrdC|uniref:L-threonylcarbamoyladenylate synthase n=1 Tax=Gulosibacter faecalis TaxID=272240 RepID=A0ABW5UZD9_9MICO|nr:Sua5/YciO/YrdC/YwlC family protein [Gulosibacter faecalis]